MGEVWYLYKMQKRESTFQLNSVHILHKALAMILLAWPTIGCASAVDEAMAETKFLAKPKADTTFWGWSEITTDQDVNSVEKVTLRAITIEPLDAPSVPDMTFLLNLTGEAVNGESREKIVEQNGMPPGERLVKLNVVYEDDVRKFFQDGKKIRAEWTGATHPLFSAWPPDGIWIRVRVYVNIE